jgi:hypothetical protein
MHMDNIMALVFPNPFITHGGILVMVTSTMVNTQRKMAIQATIRATDLRPGTTGFDIQGKKRERTRQGRKKGRKDRWS